MRAHESATDAVLSVALTLWFAAVGYATFCRLAGQDPTDTKAAQHPGIPAIDSIVSRWSWRVRRFGQAERCLLLPQDHWDAISTGAQTGRSSIVLSVAMTKAVGQNLVEDDQGNEVDEATWLQERLGSDAVGKADAGLIMWSAARMSLGVAAMS